MVYRALSCLSSQRHRPWPLGPTFLPYHVIANCHGFFLWARHSPNHFTYINTMLSTALEGRFFCHPIL